jgi:hypothetical protein
MPSAFWRAATGNMHAVLSVLLLRGIVVGFVASPMAS